MRTPRFARRLLLVVPWALITPCSDPSPTDLLEACEETLGQAVLELVNEHRTAGNLEPLVVDVRLVEAAQGHSADMAANNFMSHTGSDGSSPGQRISASDYPWRSWSENVAAGQATASAVVTAWMNSPGHRDNIMRASSQHVGIGYAFGSSTTYGHYWTMNFGSSDSPPESGSGCHP